MLLQFKPRKGKNKKTFFYFLENSLESDNACWFLHVMRWLIDYMPQVAPTFLCTICGHALSLYQFPQKKRKKAFPFFIFTCKISTPPSLSGFSGFRFSSVSGGIGKHFFQFSAYWFVLFPSFDHLDNAAFCLSTVVLSFWMLLGSWNSVLWSEIVQFSVLGFAFWRISRTGFTSFHVKVGFLEVVGL